MRATYIILDFSSSNLKIIKRTLFPPYIHREHQPQVLAVVTNDTRRTRCPGVWAIAQNEWEQWHEVTSLRKPRVGWSRCQGRQEGPGHKQLGQPVGKQPGHGPRAGARLRWSRVESTPFSLYPQSGLQEGLSAFHPADANQTPAPAAPRLLGQAGSSAAPQLVGNAKLPAWPCCARCRSTHLSSQMKQHILCNAFPNDST